MMSKDGDWILRETPEALDRVLEVLSLRGARYRLGAPLDVRWMAGGWSAYFELSSPPMRVRTDFVTRPPRLSAPDLAELWREQAGAAVPFVDARRLIELKKTNREKDYAVIGELARTLEEPRDQLLASRSARDIAALARAHPALVREVEARRPLLRHATGDLDALERAVDAERRDLMHANERRIERYLAAASLWRARWADVERETAGLSLLAAHDVVASRAVGVLPFLVSGPPS